MRGELDITSWLPWGAWQQADYGRVMRDAIWACYFEPLFKTLA